MIMKPDIQVGSKIKVTDKKSEWYRWRGVVSEELKQVSLLNPKDYEVVSFICTLHKDGKNGIRAELKPGQVACIQKKFIDIEHIREEDIDLGNGIIRKNNVGAFEVGDLIQITTKIDGANASISYNEDEGKLEIFSRTNLLDGADGLRGFKAYIQTKFKPDEFAGCPDLVIFGEWLVPHKINDYEKKYFNNWHVYDIWSKTKKNYMPQEFVKAFCAEHGIDYIEVLYDGQFVSWEHCRSFMHLSKYGPRQEGIVVKNQTKLDANIRAPKYLKIVNDAFKESMAKKEKREVDPEVQKEMDNAKSLMASIVTEARVHKAILKLVDEGVLPVELTPKCMGTVMKNLPAMIWNDVVKEENETVSAAGAYAGKFCSGLVAEHAKKLIIGK